jgi:membrane fusion protein (multidrug efflux system)
MAGALTALAISLSACGGEEAAAPIPLRPAVVTPVLVQELEERIEVSGELLAKHEAEVAAQVAGEITEILFDEGDAVDEGAVVIEIDPEKRNLDLEAARARVGEAEASVAEQVREVKRMRALVAKRISSETQLDSAETALQTARSRLRAARAELGSDDRALRDASVKARFAGFIARRYVSRGEFVAVGQKLFELVSLDPIEVEFHLPEADSSRVRKGVSIEVTVAPYPDDVFDAVVHVVSPTIDPRTRTLRVKALIDNGDGRLRPGLFARANLGIAQRSGVITVPEEAVLQRSDGAVVFRVLAGHRVERLVVETGIIRDGWVEIRSHLKPGDSIVSRGHADLIDGSVIAVRNPDGSLAVSAGSPGTVKPGS